MTDEQKIFMLALIDDSVVGVLVLSAAFLIVAGGISLMKWVGVF